MEATAPVSLIRPDIAVQATPDYVDGDAIGPKITLANFARYSGGSGVISRLQLRAKNSGGIVVQSFLHIFDSDPSATTVTDNGALTIAAGDHAKILKTIPIAAADWAAPKGASPWYTCEAIGRYGLMEYLEYKLPSGRDLVLIWEADGTINFGAPDDAAMVIAQFPS